MLTGTARLNLSDCDRQPHRKRERYSGLLRAIAVWSVVSGTGLQAIHSAAQEQQSAPFAVRVVDAATQRGVPLVVLRTTNEQVFVTDSAGFVVIDEPDLVGRKVYFHVSSHGYEFPPDGFGFRGRALDVRAGESVTLEIKRLNIAERLYRVTGGGIYAESAKLGRLGPLREPLGTALVMGQDSVQAVPFADHIQWFWGDTNQLKYPLGLFRTSGAISLLPSRGGLAPDVGVDLTYLVNDDGFSRPLFEAAGPGVVWLDGVCVVPDASGRDHLIGHYSRREGLARQLAHGLAEFDPGAGKFETLVELPESTHLHPLGQATRIRSEDGVEYVYFANPYPSVRVRATFEAVCDPRQYEGFAPTDAGTEAAGEPPASGYSWQRGVEPLTTAEERKLIESGRLSARQAHWQTIDAATGERVLLHAGSVRWNAHRRRFVMIAVQHFGKPSFLGEVWYAEAARPEGPWTKGVRIVTHDKYSFYNPTHHDFFDEDGGRLIYFEGTYTHTFSGNPVPTPRYDYNQIMYRLDLDDPRLAAAREP